MDLFPKDYKRSGSSAPLADSASRSNSFLSKLKNIKNKLAGGVGNFASWCKIKDIVLRLGVILSAAALVIVLLLWGGLAMYGKSLTSQIDALKKKQAEVFSDKDIAAAGRIIAFDKGAMLVQNLLKSHLYPSSIFDQLAAATVPRVQWQSFAATIKDRSITANGFAADYSFLAKQMLALEEGGFSNIKISGIALDEAGGVGFAAAFNFDPKILQK